MAAASFPAPTRPRTLLVVYWLSPHYVHLLTPDEQACSAVVSRATVRHMQKLGFSAVEFGADCDEADYGDAVHLAPSGGAKLADTVAPQIRALAQRPGYLTEPAA